MRAVPFLGLIFLVLSACTQHIVPGVEVDARLKSYILPHSKVLAGVNFEKLKQADFFKRHQSDFELPQLNQLPAEIGMDPRRDLQSFLLAWNGTDTLALTRGDYSPEQLEHKLASASKPESFNNFTLYGDGKRDVVFLPKGVALVGSALLLKKALNENAAGSTGIPEDLQTSLQRLNKSAQIWEVSTGVIPLNQFSLRTDAASALSNIADYINGTTIGITIGNGVNFDAQVSCISEEGAQRVHDALKGVIGLARLSTHDDQLDQLKIWDSIKVNKQAKEVHVVADFPPDLADKMLVLSKGLTSRLR